MPHFETLIFFFVSKNTTCYYQGPVTSSTDLKGSVSHPHKRFHGGTKTIQTGHKMHLNLMAPALLSKKLLTDFQVSRLEVTEDEWLQELATEFRSSGLLSSSDSDQVCHERIGVAPGLGPDLFSSLPYKHVIVIRK